jgi:zinc protease
MTVWLAALLWLAEVTGVQCRDNASAAPPASGVTHLRLRNGLRVILQEDHKVPMAALVMAYRVGSRDDQPGLDGIAHLFEHMMYNGSANVGKGEHVFLVQSVGGLTNATTEREWTLYYQVFPASQIDALLFMESDRLRSLEMNAPSLERERNVVKEERLRNLSRPYGRSEDRADSALYSDFAYSHSVIGSVTSLDAIDAAALRNFHRRYYIPNNATLLLAGDFEPRAATAKIRKYFESIPGGRLPGVPRPQARASAASDAAIPEAEARKPRIDFIYRIPTQNRDDLPAFETLAALAGDGPGSRLYRQLAAERNLADGCSMSIEKRSVESLGKLSIPVRAPENVAVVEQAVESAFQALRDHPVDALELELTERKLELRRIRSERTLLSRALALCREDLISGGALRKTPTPYDIQRVARKYLRTENQTVVITAAE